MMYVEVFQNESNILPPPPRPRRTFASTIILHGLDPFDRFSSNGPSENETSRPAEI